MGKKPSTQETPERMNEQRSFMNNRNSILFGCNTLMPEVKLTLDFFPAKLRDCARRICLILSFYLLQFPNLTSAQQIEYPTHFTERNLPAEAALRFKPDRYFIPYLSFYGVTDSELVNSPPYARLVNTAMSKYFQLSPQFVYGLVSAFPDWDVLTAMDLKEAGYINETEYNSFLSDYHSAQIGNFSFSLDAKVPASFFLSRIAAYPGIPEDSLDLTVRADFFRGQLKNRCTEENVSCDDVDNFLSNTLHIGPLGRAAIPGALAFSMYDLFNRASDAEIQRRISEKPLALILLHSITSEGTFSEQHLIPHLSASHTVVVMQVSDENDIIQALRLVADRFLRIQLLVIVSHGSFDSVYLGSSTFDVGDTEVFEALNTYIAGGYVVFTGCSVASLNRYLSPNQAKRNLAYVTAISAPAVKYVFASQANSSGAVINYIPNAAIPYQVHYTASVPAIYDKTGKQLFTSSDLKKFLLFADSNRSGIIDDQEWFAISQSFFSSLGSTSGDSRYIADYDFNGDGAIGSGPRHSMVARVSSTTSMLPISSQEKAVHGGLA